MGSLHEHRLLVPLYRVSDTPVQGRRINVEINDGMNVRSWVLEAAADGRLRDSADEGYSKAWPYSRPDEELHRNWWNGFVFSSWQLLDLHNAINDYQFIKDNLRYRPSPRLIARARLRTLALAALSPRYLPSILGRLRTPPGVEQERLLHLRSESDVVELLGLAGFDPDALRQEAEILLGQVDARDPLRNWLPVIRYASFSGWSKLKGEALDCIWQRIAAEVLLRAYEDLAAAGRLDPLPDLSGAQWRTLLHGRLTPRHEDEDSLERALGTFGLSPHPRVLLLVEGETELVHIPRLLAEFGLDRPERVRVQRCKGSDINPQLLARYGITPRLGRTVRDIQLLDATPTALLIAMDAENRWATPTQRNNERRKLQGAIREEVEAQGGEIAQEDLDFLVNIHVWGEDKYELANFTNDELVPVLARLATGQSHQNPESTTWQHELRDRLDAARLAHHDIKVPVGQMRMRLNKVELAEALWPVLLAKCERELAADTIETPVLKVILEAQRLASLLSGGGYSLRKP
jgi:hypothetical protein